jgi:hypothetical protein
MGMEKSREGRLDKENHYMSQLFTVTIDSNDCLKGAFDE